MAEYSEAVAAQGLAIMKDGVAMSFDETLNDLKRGELMREAIQEYITFYDDGLVRSYYTYNKFKEILGD